MQDVGGITPGSMPPMSHSLAEEGAAILSFKLVKGGKFQVSMLSKLTVTLTNSKRKTSLSWGSCTEVSAVFRMLAGFVLLQQEPVMCCTAFLCKFCGHRLSSI